MKTVKTPKDLFFDQLSDIFSMESQLADTMRHLASLATDEELGAIIDSHAGDNEAHRAKALVIFDDHGVAPAGDPCKAIAGLIEGGNAHLEAAGEPRTRDLMLVAHCLRVEHYEIAAYEITIRLAENLSMEREASILKESLEDETKILERLLEMEPRIFTEMQES